MSSQSTTPDQALARIVRDLDTSELARRMADAFRSEIAGYRRLPAAVVEQQIFDISRRNVRLFFRTIIDGVQPSEEELGPFRRSAEERAAEGMALEDLLAAYRMGGRIGWQAIRAAAGPEDGDAVLLAAELTMLYIDRVSGAVAQTYLAERQHLVSEEERRLRELLDAVLAGDPLGATMRELAERNGFVLAAEYRPFALKLPDARAREHAALAADLRRRGMLALTEGDRVCGLAAASLTDAELADSSALRAIGEPASAPELSEALDEVRLLMDLGSQLKLSGPIDAADHLPNLLLARSPRLRAAIHRRVLEPLRDYDDPRGADLLGTLRTFMEAGMDRRASATLLHVHPNTLDYRIKRIQELTRLDLGNPGDVTLVMLALEGHDGPGPVDD